MKKYIAFLRGVNVGGKRIIPMAHLRTCLHQEGFIGVHTYIQSGNILLNADDASISEIASKIERAIQDNFGFGVPVVTKTVAEMVEILKKNPFSEIVEEKNQYFALLKESMPENRVIHLNAADYPNEEFYVSTDCVYLNYKLGAGKAKLTNTVIEKKLNTTGTMRNLKTMRKMIGLAG